MKPLTIAFSLAALALPLLAQTEDSPLVRAAKATGRLNKKPGVVITNDTLVTSGGHLATTDVTTAYPKAGPTPSVVSPYAAPQAQVTRQLQEPGSGVNSQPPAAVNSQPPIAQSTPVTGVSTTSAVSYTSTTQPPVASVKPPQP